jgi:mannosyl-3-phosphoglycerate phosphatase family protein
MKLILFTDLDGTLLDSKTYSFEPAAPALELILSKEIPLVICSSKTRREIETYRDKLNNTHPFISENGGGIFIPLGYFDPAPYSSYPSFYDEGNYRVMALGAHYTALRHALKELQTEGFDIRGFGDMEAEELSRIIGLSLAEAEMAKEREFDEPFVLTDGKQRPQGLSEAVEAKGYHLTEGRFQHLLGDSDKGKAVSVLIDMYKKQFGEILTIAVGDGPNDIPMLRAADRAVIVQKEDGTYDPRIILPGVIRAYGAGPTGWNKTIIELINRLQI